MFYVILKKLEDPPPFQKKKHRTEVYMMITWSFNRSVDWFMYLFYILWRHHQIQMRNKVELITCATPVVTEGLG